MNKSAIFTQPVEIYRFLDISGNANIDGEMIIDGSLVIHNLDFPNPQGVSDAVLTISGDDMVWAVKDNSDETVNNIGQAFYQVITESPATFDKETKDDGTTFNQTFSKIDISWNFENIIPNNPDNLLLNIPGNMRQRVLPCITKIHFDISSSANPAFYETRSIEVSPDHNYNIDTKTASSANTNDPIIDISNTNMTYNLTYKTLTLQTTISDTNEYTISVWGENESNGSKVNKLVYSGLKFKESGIPSTPQIKSINALSNTSTTRLQFDISVSDVDTSNPNTRISPSDFINIKNIDVSFTEIDSLRSITHTPSTLYGSTTSNNFLSRVHYGPTGESINITILYTDPQFNFGSKYNFQAKCINRLNDYGGTKNDGYSDYSIDNSLNDFIGIPTTLPLSTINPFTTSYEILSYANYAVSGEIDVFDINKNYNGRYASDIILFNYGDGNNGSRNLTLNLEDIEIEISDPYANKSDNFGYGKFIDNSHNLVTLECFLVDKDTPGTKIPLQEISFHGYNYQDVSSTCYFTDSYGASMEFFVVDQNPYMDLFTEDRRKGFRRKIKFSGTTISLDDMSLNNLITPFDPYLNDNGNRINHIHEQPNSQTPPVEPASNGYQIKFVYKHNNNKSKLISADNTISQKTLATKYIYVDDFANSNNMYVNNSSVYGSPASIDFIMGIPYVKSFSVTIQGTVHNLISPYRYYRSDRKRMEQRSVYLKLINANNSNYEIEVDDTVQRLHDYNQDTYFNSYISDFNFNNTDYHVDISNAITSPVYNHTIYGFMSKYMFYNLYTNSEIDIVPDATNLLNNRIFRFDYNSLSNYTSMFYHTNNEACIYEIDDISLLGSNLSTLHKNLVPYTDHKVEIRPHTPLYINGLFQLHLFYRYPNISISNTNDITKWYWKNDNGQILPDLQTYNNSAFEHRVSNYDLNGRPTINNSGYKWLVYKVDETPTSVEYVPATESANGTAGVNLSYIMNKLFGSSVENEFYNSLTNSSYNDDILVYIVGTNKTNNASFLGRIIQDTPGFDVINTWYSTNNISSASLSSISRGSACGALPGPYLQSQIRTNVKLNHPSRTNFNTTINGHQPISIYLDTNSLENHYFYFALRKSGNGDTFGFGNNVNEPITGTLAPIDDADDVSFQIVTNTTNGNANIDISSGAWTYVPSTNYTGSDHFIVKMTDSSGETHEQIVTTYIDTEATFSGGLYGSGAEKDGITGNIDVNDIDGTIVGYTVSTNATRGNAFVNNAGKWTYIAVDGYNGNDTFTIKTTDVNTGTTTVNVDVFVPFIYQIYNPTFIGSNMESVHTNLVPYTENFNVDTFTDNRYNINGNFDVSGYKWIVYKVEESELSPEYVPSHKNSANKAGINLSYIMNKLFDVDIESEFYNSLSISNYNNNIRVYIVSKTKASNTYFAGRIGGTYAGFNTFAPWYSTNNISSESSILDLEDSLRSGALPSAHMQSQIRTQTHPSHPSYNNFNTKTNDGHDPISIYVDDNIVKEHYIYFALGNNEIEAVFSGDIQGSGGVNQEISGTLIAVDENGPVSFSILIDASYGSAQIEASTGRWVYTPLLNFIGDDAFTVRTIDANGGLTDQIITVSQDTEAVATSGTSGATTSGQAITDVLIATDDDGQITDYNVTVDPVRGDVSIDNNSGEWTYVPEDKYTGTDQFTITTTDISGGTTTFNINLIVSFIYTIHDMSLIGSNMLSIHSNLNPYNNPFNYGTFVTQRYDLDGNLDNSSSGYKWIVYKVNEHARSVEYVPSNMNSKATSGINLSYIIQKLFGATVETDFYNSLSGTDSSNNILVHIVATNKVSNTHFMGRINGHLPGFDELNPWYLNNNISSIYSIADMTNGVGSGALPDAYLQSQIRENTIPIHSSYANFNTPINGHEPISIYTNSNKLHDHYFYFALR